MRKFLLLIWFAVSWTAGFAQSLPFQDRFMTVMHTNLTVHWKASSNPWPKNLWVYQTQFSQPSSMVFSNLMAIGSFTLNDADQKHVGTNGMVFSNSGRTLNISYLSGDIHFWTTLHYGPTNLARDVPETNELLQLTTNLLPKLGISSSELAKDTNGLPKLYFPYDYSEYYVSNADVINIQHRRVNFRRALDGLQYGGGDCSVTFGEHGNVVGIWLHWPNLKQEKLYKTATPEKIIEWIHEGRAYYKPLLSVDGEIPIDWKNAKSITITKAAAYYVGDEFAQGRTRQPMLPVLVRPYAGLVVNVDTGATNLELTIYCPVIDETKP